MHDIAEFLRAHEPFAGLEETVLDQLAARTEVEFFGAEDVIFRQGEPELGHVRIIRRGSVELVDSGRVLDLLGEGEWFGHPAMLSGLPTGWAARAAEDTLCYRLAAEDVVPLLARPAGLRFVARSLMERPRPGQPVVRSDGRATSDLPARALIHERLVICDPDTPIREAARRMVEQRASCVLVTLASGELGIMTDHDLRVRVVAEGLSFDEPVSRVMSAPAVTADPDRLGTELMLSMIDSGLVWDGDATPRLDTFAREVRDDLARAGFRPDPHGATAASPLFARSASDWGSTIRHWLERPSEEKVLIGVSLLVDGRVIAGHGQAPDVLGELLAEGRHHPQLLRLLRRLALAQRPPTGFMRDIVVEHGGRHRGHFDIKRGGLLPIVDIARYAGLAAGATSTSTPERLRAAGAAGVLREDEARTLDEAFDLFAALRLEHQVEQLRAARPPDDFVDPKSLNALTRRYVREAFRVVTAVHRSLSSGLVYD